MRCNTYSTGAGSSCGRHDARLVLGKIVVGTLFCILEAFAAAMLLQYLEPELEFQHGPCACGVVVGEMTFGYGRDMSLRHPSRQTRVMTGPNGTVMVRVVRRSKKEEIVESEKSSLELCTLSSIESYMSL